MTHFAIFATLLLVVVAAFLLPPLWLGLRQNDQKAGRKEANLAIFRDQLAELERLSGQLETEKAKHPPAGIGGGCRCSVRMSILEWAPAHD